MNIPFIVLIIQVIVLSILWMLIDTGRNTPTPTMTTNLPDKELLVSVGGKITNSLVTINDNKSGQDTIWTSGRVIEEIKKNTIVNNVGITPAELTTLLKANAQPKVYFDVGRINSIKTAGIITYETIFTQSANSGISSEKGIFTAPLTGLYRMTFTGQRFYFVEAPTPTRISMKKNGKRVGYAASTSEVKAIDLNPKPPGGESLNIHILLELSKGDQVLCEIEIGGIYDTAEYSVTHFTGELMIEK